MHPKQQVQQESCSSAEFWFGFEDLACLELLSCSSYFGPGHEVVCGEIQNMTTRRRLSRNVHPNVEPTQSDDKNKELNSKEEIQTDLKHDRKP